MAEQTNIETRSWRVWSMKHYKSKWTLQLIAGAEIYFCQRSKGKSCLRVLMSAGLPPLQMIKFNQIPEYLKYLKCFCSDVKNWRQIWKSLFSHSSSRPIQSTRIRWSNSSLGIAIWMKAEWLFREGIQKNVFLKENFLNCMWVGVKSPKHFSENTCHFYMVY